MFHNSAFYGIVGEPAPEWNVDTWLNLPDGQSHLQLSDLRGQVVYVFYFQAWCTGCHQEGFPTLLRVMDEFAAHPHVTFAAIQTTFEGFEVNTLENAKAIANQYHLSIPIGHHTASHNGRPPIMKDYRTGGTPWTVIIDTEGIVRYNDFTIEPPHASRLIHYLISRRR